MVYDSENVAAYVKKNTIIMAKNKENSETVSLTVTWLYDHGYTLRGAGKALGLTGTHIGKVLRGERESKPLIARLLALPQREPVKPKVFLPEFK